MTGCKVGHRINCWNWINCDCECSWRTCTSNTSIRVNRRHSNSTRDRSCTSVCTYKACNVTSAACSKTDSCITICPVVNCSSSCTSIVYSCNIRSNTYCLVRHRINSWCRINSISIANRRTCTTYTSISISWRHRYSSCYRSRCGISCSKACNVTCTAGCKTDARQVVCPCIACYSRHQRCVIDCD